MNRTPWIVFLAALVTGCASPQPREAKLSSLSESDGLAAPPELSQPDSAPAPASSTPGAAQGSDAMPGDLAAAEPSAELAPDKPAGEMELLGEISSRSAAAPATKPPCNFDNCGVIISIGPRSGQELPQELPLDPAFGPGVDDDWYFDDWGYVPEQYFSEANVSSGSATYWVIVVQMHDGSMLPISQKFEPLLQVGDPVMVEANTIKLWN